jgi:pimeloyl-ACP methyl ester carboxylesterase
MLETTPDTIVLIHGFWVTPRSWEKWKTHFETKGYTVLTPGYPGFEVEVEALREDPTPIEKLQVHPGKDDNYVDYHDDSRPPLLFIVGKQDHLFPPQGRPFEREALQVEVRH